MKQTSPGLRLDYQRFDSALGWMLLAASHDGICLLHFCGAAAPSHETCTALLNHAIPDAKSLLQPQNQLLDEARTAVLNYLDDHRPVPALRLDLRFATSFQHQVWKALCAIPFGQTRSYLQVAQAVGKPQSSRAVGQACGKNPVPIFIPCHRVITTDGKLGGFSGGIHLKEALLKIEQVPGFV